MPASQVAGAFAAEFGYPAKGLWAAPGRINLIGEHTDYNQGYVLPVALSGGVVAAAAPRPDRRLRVRSLQAMASPVDVDLDGLAPGSTSGWAAYAV
ncbi:MAG TPA: galactokinase family protein, partial [Acidimicrobiales bacterium]|nr:galactokinase family protein [Acidimicrobiales bacterium]